MAVKKTTLRSAVLTKEQKADVDAWKDAPVNYDEELPRFTKSQLSQFKRISNARQEGRKKQIVSLRLSSATMQKAKSLGRGYTSVLSRLLDIALSDPELVKRAL